MKNKAVRLLIALIMTLNVLAFGVSAETESEINALGIFPESVIQAVDDAEIHRDEFAYIAAKIIQSGEIQPSGTNFTDVAEDNIYSGYIRFLTDTKIINGNGNSRFMPDNPIKVTEAYKIMVDILGLTGISNLDGTWEDNYFKAAHNIGITKGVVPNVNGMLTKKAAVQLISNVLFNNLPDEMYFSTDGKYQAGYSSEGTRTILAERFGISVYRGTVGSVDIAENTAEFTVSDNVYDTNPEKLSVGAKITLNPQNGINLYEYEHIPVIIWTNNSGELVYINFSGEVEVKYGYILSVNGDSDKDSKYGTDYITRITIENSKKEYTVADDAVIKKNRNIVDTTVALAQRFAKVVLINGKVAYIESWDLVEGGIITSLRGGEIRYTTGERVQASIDKYDECTERLFFIGDRRADESEIKTNSLFYYFIKDDFSLIVVSEKIITDKFISISDKNINIGGTYYDIDGVYYSEDGERYKLNENANKLYGLIVNAYLAPNGKVLYVKPENGGISRTEFIGVVCGVSDPEVFTNERQIALWTLDGENPEKIMCSLNSKTKYEDAITLDMLMQNVRNYEGKGIFKFVVNDKGTILKVSKLSPFYGFGEGRVIATTTSLHGANRAYLMVNGKRLYFDQSKITVLYNDNGEFAVKQITWSDIRERGSSSGFTFEFFGDELESIPSLVLMTGDVSTIGSAGRQLGFVAETGGKILDEAGDVADVLDVYDKNGKTQYKVSEEIINRIPSRAMVLFNHSLKFSNDGIYLWAVVDLTGDFDSWTMRECSVTNTYVGRGIVKKYDGIRLYLEDGTTEFVNTTTGITEFDNSAKNPFTFGKTQYDIKPGDSVFYFVYDGVITDIVYAVN